MLTDMQRYLPSWWTSGTTDYLRFQQYRAISSEVDIVEMLGSELLSGLEMQ